ncbi:VOC family protein [Thermobifida cellulosilytica]|uniref:VOC domain-containing protein n=1 Tax=Thermobifida cellulosilytica TB100 TaxID=665004 RepID=A0A147KMG6_THECS|nr:VOC family protein [Thermobifida cellulosilytica]KUP98453.1 hypothetical protein AC529_01235 [Thermobifida cellulosilytica TB100]
MTYSIAYAPGAPAWLDLTVTDPDAAQRFYAAVLGWEFTDDGPYRTVRIGGRRIAALSSPADGAPPPGRPAWTVYLATHDLDATLAAVRAAGGTVAVGRSDLPGLGSTAIVQDPAGTACGLWQGSGLAGSEASGIPGAPAWAEVASPDPATAEFFAAVFGLTAERLPGVDFTSLTRNGDPLFGVHGGGGRDRRGTGAWLPYFTAADVDGAAARAGRAGGTVLRAPADSPYGRWAVLADPAGARFAVARPVD